MLAISRDTLRSLVLTDIELLGCLEHVTWEEAFRRVPPLSLKLHSVVLRNLHYALEANDGSLHVKTYFVPSPEGVSDVHQRVQDCLLLRSESLPEERLWDCVKWIQ